MTRPIALNGAGILVTGASSGIGQALVTDLLREGARVVGTVRNERDAQKLREMGCAAVVLDVRDHSSHTAALEAFRPIDVLVNNAGHSYRSSIEHGDDAQVRELLEVNFFAPCALMRATLPAMMRRGVGAVVNISSASGRVAAPLNGYYSASKHALEAVTESLSHEMRPFGVRVILIEPGRVRTNLHERLYAEARTYEDPDSRYRYLTDRLAPHAVAGVEPAVVAKVVIDALTADEQYAKLRWPATPDAERLLAHRSAMADPAFFAYHFQHLGIEGW